MKLKAVAVAFGLCAAGMLTLPDGALAFRGGVHGGRFHGGGAWHGGGRHWAGGGRHWAGGRGWHGGYWRGGSLIACPLSMIFFVAASGHGSLRGRNNPPQHLVRRKHRRRNVQNELACNDAAQGAPSQPPVPSPGGQPSHLLSRSMNLRNNGVKWRLRAPTNGMVVPNARCYAG